MTPNPYYKDFTPHAAATQGYAAAATGGTWALSGSGAADSMGHLTTIINNSATDHSAKTAVITGTDANDNALDETVNLPAGSATVTGTKFFKTVTSIVPSATIGADTMDLGYAVTAVTPWFKFDYNAASFLATVALVILAGTMTFNLDHTYDFESEAANAFNDATGKSASYDFSYNTTTRAFRFKVTANTGASFRASLLQGSNC